MIEDSTPPKPDDTNLVDLPSLSDGHGLSNGRWYLLGVKIMAEKAAAAATLLFKTP